VILHNINYAKLKAGFEILRRTVFRAFWPNSFNLSCYIAVFALFVRIAELKFFAGKFLLFFG
jgi:hypothetical protein